MKIVKIIGKEKVEDRVFRAEVVFPSDNCYEVTIRDPFIEPGEIETDQEERLRWYFEDHLSSPFTDRERAKRAEKSIAFYGESLFSSLFIQNEALTEWRNLVNDLDKIRVQVYSRDPAFQAMHWESLKDPQESKAFCLMGVEFIRTSGAVTPDLKVQSSSCLNLLMVTARPGGKDDIEYRTITRPVVETIEKNRMQVRVHLLRPPTLQSLTEHLREKKGFYHIVHFDVHGCVLSFPQYKTLMDKSLNGKSRGQRAVEAYEGTRAFIDLVGREWGDDLVPADVAADLLREAHVPVCFLNACQSSMATWKLSEKEKESVERALALDASLAMTFLERGVRLVLGMTWSLTVIGAQIMMKTLYDALTQGEEPGNALNKARQGMFDDGCRFFSKEMRVDLEDWLLPVVWGKGDFTLHLQLQKLDTDEKIAYLEQERQREKELEGVKTEGQYGFLGRDVDILSIESLLLEKNILLIKGMGGTGKTTLLGHMAQWWMKTGWIDHVFYFGYDRKPYHAEEILNTIAEIVTPQGEYGTFLATPDVEMKAMALADFLKKSKETSAVLLILDNMESIAGTEQAAGSRLEKTEQDKLVRVLKTLMRSSIKILLGSRSNEPWLGKHTFKDKVYVLEGLDMVSRYAMAERIVKNIPIDDRDEFNRLMNILAGYPLAMEIILPNLGTRSAKELREMLMGRDIDLKGRKVSEEIFKCINISFSLLDPEVQNSLLVFAPFTSFLNTMSLEVYLKGLQKSTSYSNLTLENLKEALHQGEIQGLLKKIFPNCYTIQPVLPFFLGQRVEQFLDREEKVTLEQAFCGYMTTIANNYKLFMEANNTDNAEIKQLGFKLFEYDKENLFKAMHWLLDTKDDFYPIYSLFAKFYLHQPLYQEAIKIIEGVLNKLNLFSKKDQKFLTEYAYVIGDLGTNYLQINRFSEARKNYERSLNLLKQVGNLKDTAVNYHQLGMVAHGERDFKEAKRNYHEALKIKQELYNKRGQASTYHQLGNVAYEEEDWIEAKKNYLKALKINQDYNDRQSQANNYHQLGMVAFEEQNWEEAKKNFNEALKIHHEFNDVYAQAKTYHGLGIVAQEEGDLNEAKKNLLQDLKICQEFNDKYGQAMVYGELGNIAKAEKDYVLSMWYFSLTLEIFYKYGDDYNTNITIRNLYKLMKIKNWDVAGAIEQLEVEEETKKALRAILEKVGKETQND
ncbi:MAG: tetratricopeptide repeat protein [Candidatus Aminicenantes bacterium]|nr:tetratricopeptide repeat protein [Candidatus Aminicenantes bacterium]NIM81695.1 tetratricopeptide repeat protein [Candidatus Aminicenantes bacterium]NIN21066.1 tetratricopeptide repeat protein [Candidatus Aminicenantes bacterium]NIN44888.1 tetratricopeptide repeat protein [Candidatus Aminicenantes bacterium]NIN87702.1 tetratricopeptide repeat protein [Candidatus Aminicenantes bacterium]